MSLNDIENGILPAERCCASHDPVSVRHDLNYTSAAGAGHRRQATTAGGIGEVVGDGDGVTWEFRFEM